MAAKKKHRLRKFLIRAVILLVLVVGLLVGGTWWYLYDHYIHPERQANDSSPAEYNLEFEDVVLESHDGLDLRGWLVMPPLPERRASMPAVIALHGYGTNRSNILERVAHLARSGFLVFTYDHRGSGESGGNEVTLGMLEINDLIEVVIPYVRSLEIADSDAIGIYGYSMGGMLAINAAAMDEGISAVVADSPYASLDLMTEKILKDRGLPPWPFVGLMRYSLKNAFGRDVRSLDARSQAAGISPAPLLLLHGEEDSTVPIAHAEMIIDAAREPKRLVTFPGHDHEDNGTGKIMKTIVIPFFKEYLEVEPQNHDTIPAQMPDEETLEGLN